MLVQLAPIGETSIYIGQRCPFATYTQEQFVIRHPLVCYCADLTNQHHLIVSVCSPRLLFRRSLPGPSTHLDWRPVQMRCIRSLSMQAAASPLFGGVWERSFCAWSRCVTQSPLVNSATKPVNSEPTDRVSVSSSSRRWQRMRYVQAR